MRPACNHDATGPHLQHATPGASKSLLRDQGIDPFSRNGQRQDVENVVGLAGLPELYRDLPSRQRTVALTKLRHSPTQRND